MHATASLLRASAPGHAHVLAWRLVIAGGLAIAATDLAYCVLYWSPQGVPPARLLQGIAAGALGPAAFNGGVATVLLGFAFQWLIGCGFVLAYALAAAWSKPLRGHALRFGTAYGLLLYLVMNGVVVPLSAAPQPAHPQLAWMLANVPMFALFGTLAARFALRVLAERR